MSDEMKTVELKEEDLEKITGGDQEPKEESITTSAYTGNLPNTLFVDCPFCNVNRQFIYNKWMQSNSFILNCGCKLDKISMMSVKITKHQD